MDQFTQATIRQAQQLGALNQELQRKIGRLEEHLADAREAASLDREELRIVQVSEGQLAYDQRADRAALKAYREMIRACRDAAVTTEDGTLAGPLKTRILQITAVR